MTTTLDSTKIGYDQKTEQLILYRHGKDHKRILEAREITNEVLQAIIVYMFPDQDSKEILDPGLDPDQCHIGFETSTAKYSLTLWRTNKTITPGETM
jgi:hypothetical protein